MAKIIEYFDKVEEPAYIDPFELGWRLLNGAPTNNERLQKYVCNYYKTKPKKKAKMLMELEGREDVIEYLASMEKLYT
jgi:hypothetical protein